MGQHKYNSIAIKAKNSEIKPKEKGISEAESWRKAQDACRSYLKETFQIYIPPYYNICDDELWKLLGG